MFNCKRRCRNCFPNGCCGFCKPPPQVQQQVDTVIHLKKAVIKKETPYGYIKIYSGVRTPDNNYTCPVLSVHRYYHSHNTADIAKDKRTVIVGRNNQQIHQGPQQMKRADECTAEEEVTLVPLEDITYISYESQLKKGVEADIEVDIERVYGESENCCDRCCDGLLSCCRRTRDLCCHCCQREVRVAPLVQTTTAIFSGGNPNLNRKAIVEHLPPPEEKRGCCDRFRCWCCRKQRLTGLIKRTYTEAEQQAQRVVTMTIEYSKYSNLDTLTNARLLSTEHQLAYYKEKFQPDTKLEFYLVNNTEYDLKNFEVTRNQAESLCRTVLQLKGMKNHYPSDDDLDKILDQSHTRTIGNVYEEPILQLAFDSATARTGGSQIQELPHQASIEQNPTTISE